MCSADNTGVTRVSAVQIGVDPWLLRLLMVSHFLESLVQTLWNHLSGTGQHWVKVAVA